MMKLADSLSGKELDSLMYKHACQSQGKTPSQDEFEQGYTRGEFHFVADAALLGDLIALHQINLHRVGGEWLAFRDSTGCYGESPSVAVCRWLVTVKGIK